MTLETGEKMHYLGNRELLGLHKIAFLCSRTCPKEAALKATRWAKEQCAKKRCVISGFHSRIEKEVLSCLLQGDQPIVIVLARGLREPVEPELEGALQSGRLLIMTRYAPTVSHACEEKCLQRNRLMMDLADEIVIAYASPGGGLERLCEGYGRKEVLRL